MYCTEGGLHILCKAQETLNNQQSSLENKETNLRQDKGQGVEGDSTPELYLPRSSTSGASLWRECVRGLEARPKLSEHPATCVWSIGKAKVKLSLPT